ncbi:hypothetical protein DSO57_1028989 [Entomophthora muscae]|uniref:Uncharacterized protein n=1 Tax=Entomophthora muscae TaxID=34485 RepID=A0ACC2T1G7_9FUNG|nr:hypothetical protein DSO57_1028989 [Entomophthora muscae]
MTTRGREFIEGEFRKLFKDWYQPKDRLNSAALKVYRGDARLVIEKILEEFAAMQSKYKLSSKKLPHMENDSPIQLAPGFDPGHVMVINELEHHRVSQSKEVLPRPGRSEANNFAT